MVIRVNIFKRYSLTLSDDLIANGKSSDTTNVTWFMWHEPQSKGSLSLFNP